MTDPFEFPACGGEVGALMRRCDWSNSPLGSPQSWPNSLRTVVALLLQSAPTITPEAVKVRLKAASRIPHKAAGTFANGWGFGLIDGNRL